MKIATAVSAGGLAYRYNGNELKVLITARNKRKIWCLPKGRIEEGETEAVAALREVREETGMNCEIVKPLKVIEYWFYWKPDDTKINKKVHFFLMKSLSGNTDDHDGEVDEARFVTPEEAGKKLTFPGEREILRLALEAIGETSSINDNKAAEEHGN